MHCGEKKWQPGSCAFALWTAVMVEKMLYACTMQKSGGSQNGVFMHYRDE